MEPGFVVDHDHGSYRQSVWMSGLPEKSFWTGVKVRGREKLPVVTFRCPGCGRLDAYAEKRTG
jgi:hypothetical protein